MFALYLAEDKIAPEAVENMRGWPHSGFSVDQSVFLPTGDRAGIERLMQYMTRCPFSLSRLVKVSATGQVIYKAERDACRAFPEPHGDGLASGPKRNFQVLDPLDFLAEFTQHIPPKGAHLIRYYGWYSNKARGMRRKAAEQATANSSLLPGEGQGVRAARRCSQTWAMLIKRVYEIDPLACPKCGGQMKVVAFIEPPQGAIEKIVRHCGLWHPSVPRAPPPGDDRVYVPDSDWDGQTAFSDGRRELTYVPETDWDSQTAVSDEPWEMTCSDVDTFEATF